MEMIYQSELDAFGFTGTCIPAHIKEMIFSFTDDLLSEDQKEYMENRASRCIDQRMDLPLGIYLSAVKLISCEEW